MSYTTQQDILDFVEDNNVKFVRFAFCDIFGFQKNIAVLASDLPKALEDGVCFDGSAIAGFMHVEESDLVLRPDLSTMTILPWRTAEGRVMQFFCDVEKPDNTPFGGNCRGFLRDINRRFKQLGLRCNVGTECEFYLFENDDRGRPTRIPIDAGGYFDPLRVLPSCVIGAALSGALSMTFGCALRAPHGGIFVFPVVDHAVMYCVALAVGSVVGAVILSLLKKTRTEE